MLVDEVAQAQRRHAGRLRTIGRWTTRPSSPSAPVGAVDNFAGPLVDALEDNILNTAAEGFRIRCQANRVAISGNDERGVLFGIGYLLRHLHMTSGKITLDDGLHVTTAPEYPLRGHQLGYRPKTNSYDAWDLPQWEQYYRDLAVFGCNAVELIPPRSDDAADSPHFPRPPLEMMVGMSRLADDYGLDVWIWYPAMDKDYSDPEDGRIRAGRVGRRLQGAAADRRDLRARRRSGAHAAQVSDGAAGKADRAAAQVSSAGADVGVAAKLHAAWMDEFYDIMRDEPAWLGGHRLRSAGARSACRSCARRFRRAIRFATIPTSPTSRQCQYPVPDWDLAHALTSNREAINPRPTGQATIFRLLQPYTIGFLTYSEGCNDDVNKSVWSGLGWNPEQPVIDILREFGRYFIGDAYADDFAQGLLGLERNWHGALLTNAEVDVTLEQFQDMERRGFARVLKQLAVSAGALPGLLRCLRPGPADSRNRLGAPGHGCAAAGRQRPAALAAIDEAEKILDAGRSAAWPTDLRKRVFRTGRRPVRQHQDANQRAQVPGHRRRSRGDARHDRRAVRQPAVAQAAVRRVAEQSVEEERLRGIDEIVNWTDPGPGGFYDDLGKLDQQPHLVVGPGFEKDPAFLESSHTGFAGFGPMRAAWKDHAESLLDAPLNMRYENLDPTAQLQDARRLRRRRARKADPLHGQRHDRSASVHPEKGARRAGRVRHSARGHRQRRAAI